MLEEDRRRNPVSGRPEMTNTRSIAGATVWVMLSLTLAFAALEPVQARTTCPAASMMVGKVCTNLSTGEIATDCKPQLA
jgi:hypothetical protein